MNNSIISSIKVVEKPGQHFITWHEKPTLPGTTFKVYNSTEPITPASLTQATLLASHIEPFSARDWWLDPASFSYKEPHRKTTGFKLETDAQPLNSASGLFVHTITESENEQKLYYAVTVTDKVGIENRTILTGLNSIKKPLLATLAMPQPIILENDLQQSLDACRHKPLVLSLHCRGGGMTAGPDSELYPVNALFFGNNKMGWREGLAFKFNIKITDNAVWLEPNDRAWTGGRPVTESKDGAKRDHCPAVNTFWYGYNSNIHTTTLGNEGKIHNYTEEYLVFLIEWAHKQLMTDKNRTYIVGASMGGSGALTMSFHYPQLFAATVAHVGAVAYTEPGKGTAVRLENSCGPLSKTTLDYTGRALLQYMNGIYQAEKLTATIPYLYMTNGRHDESFPWTNKPPFYRAMQHNLQGLTVYWNNGDHDMHKDAPADFFPANLEGWVQYLQNKFALNCSFPVFTKCSTDGNYGNGDTNDGDLEGWINRGIKWNNIIDQNNFYSINIIFCLPKQPIKITSNLTLRRRQYFTPAPGSYLTVDINKTHFCNCQVQADGLFTIKKLLFTAGSEQLITIKIKG